MATKTSSAPSVRAKLFPAAAVEDRLRDELEEAAAEGDVLRGGWEPCLDSLRMVSVVVGLEAVVGFKLPPEKIVRKGGYKTIDEGVTDMFNRIQSLWQEKHATEAA